MSEPIEIRPMTEHISPDLPDQQWWLSFADADRPKGMQFLGVVITNGPTLIDAVARTHRLAVNPGGSVRPVGPLPLGSYPADWCDRLLSRDEAENAPTPGWAMF